MTRAKLLLLLVLLSSTTLAAVDLIAYLFFNDLGKSLSPAYAKSEVCESSFPDQRAPRHYFSKHVKRGFDLSPGALAYLCNHPPEGPAHKVWGNSLGCFDNEKAEGYVPDVYLAGDSFTWGYAPFDKKFGTILETTLGRNVLKCGVTHTGQKHQYSKFLDISSALGRYPKTVIVNYSSNDIANDFAYPHTTVIDGYLVENRFLSKTNTGDLHIIAIDDHTLDVRLGDLKSNHHDISRSWLGNFLLTYSLSSNITYALLERFVGGEYHPWEAPHARSFYELEWRIMARSHGKRRYPIYSPYAIENRKALRRWAEHSRSNNYRLIVSLIPPKGAYGRGWYQDVEAFLKSLGIEYYNFETYVLQRSLDPLTLYWVHDEHFNIRGNEVYAEYLSSVL